MQQGELGAGQFDGPIVHREAVLVGVKDDAAHPQLLQRCDPAKLDAAQQGAHAGDNLTGIKGLGHVVVGAQFEADDLVGVLDPRGEHDNGHGAERLVAADDTCDLPTVAVGQHQVKHHQVGPLAAQQVQGLLAVEGGGDRRTRPVRGNFALP